MLFFQEKVTLMERVGFLLKIKQDRIDEYRERHQSVWSEMLEALHEAGWTNYSLFLSPEGLLFGYLETPDFEKAVAKMAKTEVNARWQKDMAPFFEGLDGTSADQGLMRLEEVFHVD